MSKCCLYVTNDLKVCGCMKEVSIKEFQFSFLEDNYLDQKKWEGQIGVG
jgi:hypothetical protein